MFPYSRQSIDKKDILSAVRVLKSDFLTQGPLVNKFEKKILNYVKAKYAVATNSGSSALHIACLALNLKKGDHSLDCTKYFCSNRQLCITLWG